MKRNLLFFRNSRYFRLYLSVLLAAFTFLNAFAQSKRVTGVVSDNAGPIPGASVRVKGSTVGTTTTATGTYTLNVPDGAILEVTYVGYTTQEIAVGDRTTINITLASNSQALQEIVVVGYGTAQRKDLTGSVSSVSADQIAKVPVTQLDQALQGRSAGVQVTNNDGAPGAGVSVQIRGVGSLGSNDPLYVVDGYPITGGLNNINPSDIASMDILKDASATAIYGVRAANGVVIITTKRGRKDGVQVTLDLNGSIQAEPKKYNILNAEQWATLANETPIDKLPEWSNPSALTNVNWQDAVYRTGSRQNYNLAIRGGSEKVQTAFSAGYYDQKGIVLGSFFKRINLGLNIDYNVNKWLKANASAKYSRQNSANPFGTGSLLQLASLIPTIGANSATKEATDGNGNYGFYNPVNIYTKSWNNPVYFIETLDTKNQTNYFLSTTSLEATIVEGLKVKTNLGINTSDFSGYYFTPADLRTLVQYGVASNNNLSTYSQSANNTYEWLWENTISYNKVFGKHTLDLLAGVSEQKNNFRTIGGSGNDLPSNSIRDLSQVRNLIAFGNQTVYTLASQFGRLSYKYDDKYLLTATVRRDGSSRFYKGNQYGVFPSASFAWRAKQEDFLKDVNFLSDLKFRVGYGEVGSQANIPLFQYLARYSSGGPATAGTNVGYPFGGTYQTGLAYLNLDNQNLTWETSRQTNIGVDLAILNNDLTFTVDWYRKDSKDFLLRVPIASQSGVTTQAQNAGSIRNQGFEFALNYRKKVSQDFNYGLGLNLTTVNNKLLSINNSINSLMNLVVLNSASANGWNQFSRTYIGQPVGEFYGYESLGIFQTQAEIDALNANAPDGHYQGTAAQPTVPGDRKFRDINGDGQITADDRTSLGSPIPKFYGGFNLDLNYKAFDFNAFFYGSYGNKIFNYSARNLESFQAAGFVGVQNVSQEYYENRWTPTNPSNRYARVNYNDDISANNVPSSVYVENGSYLRLRNVTLGYTLPSDVAKKLALSKLRLSFSAQNLFTITKYSGLDPEIGQPTGNDANDATATAAGPTAAGIDVGTYPLSRFYTLGIVATF
ncbi:TonB-dependent receptor [Mucilaginibacter sp. JRF]|uniref:SusC/RagA family TonB-linked outer membrane protein n=1 Tax=Mucilaginibacter sp. JRF TaxID=2780088 RepID=UPI001880C69D|nr:TonB-dependent receptor [Mucilaginibacter sp. JRF]MBE9585423.1 TonB-dependent receptor [Mucilaginibacter sp. JRF]